MDTKDFKKVFNVIALKNEFENEFGAWFKESEECVLALILVKSNYSKIFYLRIKVNLKRAFGKTFDREKEWVKHDIADIMVGPGNEFTDLFDLENEMLESERMKEIEKLFSHYINRLTDKLLTRKGLIKLHDASKIYLLPAIKKELGIN